MHFFGSVHISWDNLLVHVYVVGYTDVDCGLRESDVPSVTGILETPACCSIQCEDDDCLPRDERCTHVGLRTINATYNATCRFQVNTVRPPVLLSE